MTLNLINRTILINIIFHWITNNWSHIISDPNNLSDLSPARDARSTLARPVWKTKAEYLCHSSRGLHAQRCKDFVQQIRQHRDHRGPPWAVNWFSRSCRLRPGFDLPAVLISDREIPTSRKKRDFQDGAQEAGDKAKHRKGEIFYNFSIIFRPFFNFPPFPATVLFEWSALLCLGSSSNKIRKGINCAAIEIDRISISRDFFKAHIKLYISHEKILRLIT